MLFDRRLHYIIWQMIVLYYLTNWLIDSGVTLWLSTLINSSYLFFDWKLIITGWYISYNYHLDWYISYETIYAGTYHVGPFRLVHITWDHLLVEMSISGCYLLGLNFQNSYISIEDNTYYSCQLPLKVNDPFILKVLVEK